MSRFLTQLDPDSIQFPSPRHALTEPNGLLAIGGDLSPQRLLLAYHNGIFPWYGAHHPILWWSPNPRGVLPPEHVHVSRSMQKLRRNHPYEIWINRKDRKYTVIPSFILCNKSFGIDKIYVEI